MNDTDIGELLDLAQKLVDADDPHKNVNMDVSKVDTAALAIWNYVVGKTQSEQDEFEAQRICGQGIEKCHPNCNFFGMVEDD